MPKASDIALLPEAGPLIRLPYPDALDALLLQGLEVVFARHQRWAQGVRNAVKTYVGTWFFCSLVRP